MRATSPAFRGAVLGRPWQASTVMAWADLEPQLHVGKAVFEGLIRRQGAAEGRKRSNAYWRVKSKISGSVAPTISAHCSTRMVLQLCLERQGGATQDTNDRRGRYSSHAVERDFDVVADHVERAAGA